MAVIIAAMPSKESEMPALAPEDLPEEVAFVSEDTGMSLISSQ